VLLCLLIQPSDCGITINNDDDRVLIQIGIILPQSPLVWFMGDSVICSMK